jgi:hypothetical protein
VLDLSEADEMRPAGLAMVVQLAVRAGELDVGLCLVWSNAVLSVIAGAGLRELFDLHSSIEEALTALGVTRRGRAAWPQAVTAAGGDRTPAAAHTHGLPPVDPDAT